MAGQLLHYRAGPFRALWNLSTSESSRQAVAGDSFSRQELAVTVKTAEERNLSMIIA